MRRLIAALLLLLPLCVAAATLPPQFEGSRVNAAGAVYLKAAKTYYELNAGEKAAAVAAAAGVLGLEKPVAVELDGGGELWNVKEGRAMKLDAWSDRNIYLGPKARRTGRWFASFGMQSMGGGDYPSSTLNLRLGTTLYKDRYDAAVSYDYSKPRDAVLSRSSLGLVGRMLIPLSRHGGWNLGAQVSSSDNYGVKTTAVGLVTGLNVYLPRGSFDISFTLRDKGAYGLMAGYTVFLTR
jgi:hypothetical protein